MGLTLGIYWRLFSDLQHRYRLWVTRSVEKWLGLLSVNFGYHRESLERADWNTWHRRKCEQPTSGHYPFHQIVFGLLTSLTCLWICLSHGTVICLWFGWIFSCKFLLFSCVGWILVFFHTVESVRESLTCQGVSINNNMENFSIDCRGKTVNQNNHNSHLPEPETETMTQALKIFMLIVTLCRTRKVSPNFFEVDCYILFRFPVSSTIIDPLCFNLSTEVF